MPCKRAPLACNCDGCFPLVRTKSDYIIWRAMVGGSAPHQIRARSSGARHIGAPGLMPNAS